MQQYKLGVLKETKTPPDRRVVIAPNHIKKLKEKFPNVEIHVQPSDIRAFKDAEYETENVTLFDDMQHCDILIGVKEVKTETLIEGKTYIFFSHTIKKQKHNQKLLQEIIRKKITLLDHELFTDKKGIRLVAFGRWAGVVGCYNGLIAFGLRNNLFNLKRAKDCHDLQELFHQLDTIKLPKIKLLITGNGRVAHGACEILDYMKIRKVNHTDFLSKIYDEAVYCQLDPDFYVERKDGQAFSLEHFIHNPAEYSSTFLPYTKVTDILIPCHFWDPKSPVFMTANDMRSPDFKISVIADISCDVDGPIPSTLRASTIAEPFYGYNPVTCSESDAFDKMNITVMAIDNLPGELPRDASVDFGNTIIDKVFPSLFGEDSEGVIERATIVKDGKLTPHFSYLSDFVNER